ncbi:MAG TPA: multidrug effflux MFS transporter [Acetobacteraceae bacterium]|nr:multidrug effflux MFS transporter [Acetobacteraceae bacterium]
MARSLAPQSAFFTLLLGIFAGLPALSIDLSAPTLVLLPGALATNTVVAGLTLSLFMAGFALGQLTGGPLSDRNGRRPVLLAGLLTYTVAGIACTLAWSGPALLVARLIQGAGAGACSVLAFAMVQDLFQGEAARSKRSYVTVVFGVVPVLAPALGAWLSDAAGWRSVHAVLAVAGLALLGVVVLWVAESRPAEARSSYGPAPIGERLRDDRCFVTLSIVNALSYAALFAYIAGAPVVMIRDMGYTPGAYAALFACTALALSFGAWLSGRLGRRGVGAASLAGSGLAAQAVATITLAIYCTSIGGCDARAMAALLLLTCFGRGLAAPNLMHLAIGPRRNDAGFASAILGVTQLLGGALSSAAVAALLPRYGSVGVAATMALMAASAASVWRIGTRRHKTASPRTAE